MTALGLGPLGWGLIAVVFVTVLVVFRGALEGGFVYDDFPRIVEAEGRITSIWPPAWMSDGQRPVVRLSLALNHLAGGLDPVGYHAFNLVVHASAAVLVLLVVREGGRRLADRGIVADSSRRRLIVAAASRSSEIQVGIMFPMKKSSSPRRASGITESDFGVWRRETFA